MTGPMTVTRIVNGDSSWPDPRLDGSWSDLNRLRWKAGLATYDSGLRVTVEQASAGRRGAYNVRTHSSAGDTVCGSMDYAGAWSWLSGFTIGACAGRRGLVNEDTP